MSNFVYVLWDSFIYFILQGLRCDFGDVSGVFLITDNVGVLVFNEEKFEDRILVTVPLQELLLITHAFDHAVTLRVLVENSDLIEESGDFRTIFSSIVKITMNMYLRDF